MTISEITDRVTALGHAWEQFKQINDNRLRDIENKGHADPLYDEHLGNISSALDNYRERLDRVETAYNRPSLAIGEGAKADVNGVYGKAFRNYLRKGMDAGLEALQTKALSVGSDPDGGYLVTPTMSAKIVQAIFETSPMRQICSIETISTDALELIDDHTALTAGWTAESVDITTDTATPMIAKRNLPTHELYAQPKATQKLVDDAAIDVETWLSNKIADIFSRTQNTSFVAGTGIGQPRGLLTYPSGTSWGQIQQVDSGSSGAVTADSIITLFYSLKDAYMRRASFLMNRSTIQQVRKLKSTTNEYLWQPSLVAGSPDTLLGAPVYMAADMPIPAASSLSV
ncbi:MAG: phage major capsid protein, partial [Pseudomonadota bacterium]|nr:phage major capsid protein [Pseudomonadota bacterium]